MLVVASDIKVNCIFSVVDERNGNVIEKFPFTVDIANLDVDLFKNAHEQLFKLRQDVQKTSASRYGNQTS